MFIEKIKFPNDFEVKVLDEGDYCTIVSMPSAKWGTRNMHILIGISMHGESYDSIICIGKDVDQLYGDKDEVTTKINENIGKFFEKQAKEKGLIY